MGRAKLHSRFLQADIDSPCEGCDNVNRKCCKWCQKCKECCRCNLFICSNCGGAESQCVDGSDPVIEYGRCNCEPCFRCGKIDDRDNQCYLPYRHEPYCNKCFVVVDAKYEKEFRGKDDPLAPRNRKKI